ncbi:helitron helicase-like domain-containing protein [Artemisia annua]|uniref:Helitron helicase-like domain-containing protein n=1 Tax=Artemisia annua TaxID=35608 RepID=A0A2U1KPR6_ARTAN|nr:helitron helicase-like domain-containing protein [Artemisia annua]
MSLLFAIVNARSLLFANFYFYVLCDKTPISCCFELCDKKNKRCHNISAPLSDHQPSNNSQNPPSPFICDLQNLHLQNLLTHTQSLPSVDDAASEKVSMQDAISTEVAWRKRCLHNVAQDGDRQMQRVTRNVRQRTVSHGSQGDFVNENVANQSTPAYYATDNLHSSVESIVPAEAQTFQQPFIHHGPLLQSKIECRKRCSSNLTQNEAQHSEDVIRNVKRHVANQDCFMKYGIQNDSVGCTSEGSSAQGFGVLCNQDQQPTTTAHSSQRCRHCRTAANQRKGNNSISQHAAYMTPPSMSNEGNQFASSPRNGAHTDEHYERGSQTTPTQQNKQRDHTKSRGGSRNVRRRIYSGNLGSASGDGSGPSGSSATLQTNEGVSPSYEDLGDCNERCRHCGAAFWYGEHVQRDSQQDTLDPHIVEGLIHFLDTHNELVKVLRTARDLCAQADVPEFKLKLYNGEGARGYELPTSNTLAAIVFDSGPTSESDYDVIIQYKGEQPQRINKLHKSYMSLQFPLIFIYGQPGYMEQNTMADVQDMSQDKPLTTTGAIQETTITADHGSTRKSVKRALFQDEATGSKKQKTTMETSAPEKARTRSSEKKNQI